MSHKTKPRFTKPTTFILSDERRDLLPLYNKLLAPTGVRIERPSKTDEKKGKE